MFNNTEEKHIIHFIGLPVVFYSTILGITQIAATYIILFVNFYNKIYQFLSTCMFGNCCFPIHKIIKMKQLVY